MDREAKRSSFAGFVVAGVYVSRKVQDLKGIMAVWWVGLPDHLARVHVLQTAFVHF